MKTRLVIFCLLFGGLLSAQNEPLVTKIVRVHGDADTLSQLACSGFRGICRASNALSAIVLKGPTNEVTTTEKTIKDLDLMSPAPANSGAGKNLDLTIYVLGGSDKGFVGTQDVKSPVLTPVVTQLRAVFPYSHYQLLGTMIMRSSLNGKSQNDGAIGVKLDPNISRPASYLMSYDSATMANGTNISLHLKNFRFTLQVPYIVSSPGGDGKGSYATTQYQEGNMGIETDVDLREGQKVVVGKTNISDSDSCIFLVLSAKLVP